MQEKACTQCGLTKSLESFNKRSGAKDGRRSECRECQKRYDRGWYKRNKTYKKEAVKKYDDVYFIQTNATDAMHSTSVDGIHPSDYGYTLWAQSIRKPILKILKKYGIR